MPFNIGFPELVIILLICLIIFGAGKLPGVGRALGQSIREFRQASQTKSPDRPGSEEPPEEPPGEHTENRTGERTG
ncbi:MAG: twin-arginine translocase TatA/TatE family subunit [Bacillota bacterium]